MVAVIAILSFIFTTYGVMCLTTMSVNWKDYKNYKPTYEAIDSGAVVVKNDYRSIVSLKKREDDYLSNRTPEILFFLDDNDKPKSIKLWSKPNELSYIHDTFTIFDLYQSYWCNKIVKAYDAMDKTRWVEPRPTRFYTVSVGDKKQFKFLRG